ncbi:MAG TPA: 4-hydroxy-tetrahydrodipicolinate reductase [Treponemataceae bacterium]|nr:4-hydroxy-tetrahydrodipicolinate reductase [Treponemataceae bacterium]
MKVALVGYGKMGHMIAAALASRGHAVVAAIDPMAADATCRASSAEEVARAVVSSGADGVIEFSHPSAVLANIRAIVPTGVPLVVGTTGWQASIDEVSALVASSGSALLHSANYSVGVNLFYRIVSEAARLMNEFEVYDVAALEAHHNQKADSPSGTALEIARRLLAGIDRKKRLVTDAFDRRPEPDELHLASVRVGSVPGTHTVIFDSPADTIEITHTARNREGFALGAVRGLEWLLAVPGRKGLFTMDEVFKDL